MTAEFSLSPKAYVSGSEPKGNQKRITSNTPSMKGAGNTQLTGTIILIEEKDITKSGYYGNRNEKSLTYVPRLSISPIIGQSLDRGLVVFDLYKRGTGSKRSIIQTDEYDSSWSSYDYKRSSADEFYGFIASIFNKDDELIFQRASERMLNEYARATPPR